MENPLDPTSRDEPPDPADPGASILSRHIARPDEKHPERSGTAKTMQYRTAVDSKVDCDSVARGWSVHGNDVCWEMYH
jgi:hypothetical protein